MNPLDSREDILLTTGLKAGNEQAFDQLFRKYHRELYSLAFRYLKDKDAAADAVQDVFVKLWLHRERLDDRLAVRGYLFTALKNHLLNVLRDAKAEDVRRSQAPVPLLSTPGTESDVLFAEYTRLVESGLEGLPRQKKTIFRLRVFEGLTNEQVAGKLGISINTVKVQFTKATQFLKEFLKNRTGTEF